MKLYNTKTRQLETFTPLDAENIKIYTCGPTVYGFQHIGNYASYIYWDLLVRLLKEDYNSVTRVLNLTDVGHLTSDEDSGEDKMEKGARIAGKDVWAIAEEYIEDFLLNWKSLNLLQPEKLCRATDYIAEDQKIVETIIRNGYTYETSDGIYFDTSKFPAYADFAKLDLENIKAGARVAYSSEKKNPSDFAIWKFIKEGENHAMRWDFLGHPGYPGWHLECSTIIHTELGEPIDIHTGGIDHIPVHHTNEIAQTFAVSGKDLAKFWLHCNFITIDNQKISKSLGNTYTLKDLADRGFSPLDYKMWVLSGNYQSNRNFTFEDLSGARSRRLSWVNKLTLLKQQSVASKIDEAKLAEYKSNIKSSLENNLNSAEAFAIIDAIPFEYSSSIYPYLDKLFGLNLVSSAKDISIAQKQKIASRESARLSKDYATSDQLRSELEAEHISVKDTATGPIWQYI